MSKQQRITSLTLTPLMMIAGERGGKGGGLSLKGTGGLFSEIVAWCACEGGWVGMKGMCLKHGKKWKKLMTKFKRPFLNTKV